MGTGPAVFSTGFSNQVYNHTRLATVQSIDTTTPTPGKSLSMVFSFIMGGKAQTATFKGPWAAPIVKLSKSVTVAKGSKFVLVVSPTAPYTIKSILPLESPGIATVTKSVDVPSFTDRKKLTVTYQHTDANSTRTYEDTVLVANNDAPKPLTTTTNPSTTTPTTINILINNHSSRINAMVLKDTYNTANNTSSFKKYGAYTGKKTMAGKDITSGTEYTIEVVPKAMKIRNVR